MELRDAIFDKTILFEEKAIDQYRYQFSKNPVYRRYAKALGLTPGRVTSVDHIPPLPVRAFKEARISCIDRAAPLIFKSSGTTDMERSRHDVHDPSIYRESVLRSFSQFYPDQPVVWAFMPGYRDNPASSLIRMIEYLIENDSSGLSGWIEHGGIEPSVLSTPNAETGLRLSSRKDVDQALDLVHESGRRFLLFGAAFGLLDLLDKNISFNFPERSIILETGGMKTHRREMSRPELHQRLSDGFRLDPDQIHSEYGMCELLSQAYATNDGQFRTPKWMQVSVRNPNDWLEILPEGEEGLLAITDLANLYSCSFLLTGDRGAKTSDDSFEVSGRWNPLQLRGCNFLIDDQ